MSRKTAGKLWSTTPRKRRLSLAGLSAQASCRPSSRAIASNKAVPIYFQRRARPVSTSRPERRKPAEASNSAPASLTLGGLDFEKPRTEHVYELKHGVD